MKKSISFILVTVILMACSREDVSQYAPIESYPNDTLLEHIDHKKAMIITAHDDDMCAMSGTIAMLNEKGWEIRSLALSSTESRRIAQIKACKNILDSVLFFTFDPEQFRIKKDSSRKDYEALPKDRFDEYYNRGLIEKEIIEKVGAFGPSVIFTLDNEMGGYGHPEHALVSQAVLDLAQSDSITVDYIYQSVYTDHMENTIMARLSERMISWGFPGDGWERAKAIYGVSGMPEPNVQINIEKQAQQKMEYLKSYNKREREVIGFYIPAFEDYTAEEYFKIFDREFFRVLRIDK